MNLHLWKRVLLIFNMVIICTGSYAKEDFYRKGRSLQTEGKSEQAIEAYIKYLTSPVISTSLDDKELGTYTDALVQMMNLFQSKGDPDTCPSVLQRVFKESSILQNELLRDFNSVLGYALSRTEDIDKAEEIMLKALTLPLYKPTPERYFRDYAYAAAVFYSNPDYQNEVINWCNEALTQAELCKDTSGKQWAMSMLGSLYKRNGNLSGALDLFQRSIDDSRTREDELGILNGLNSLVDLFLYWKLPEYADIHASEAVAVEIRMKSKNPMVSAQTYINKGRVVHELGKADSILFYTDKARKLCESLPYNSGMVDVDLLNGIYLTEIGGDSLNSGIDFLRNVIQKGTTVNRSKAYHKLAQTYLHNGQIRDAEIILDSLYNIIIDNNLPAQIQHIDFELIINHYLKRGNRNKAERYVKLMFQEQKAFNDRKLNYNLIESIVDLQTGTRLQELKIVHLKQTNQRLWMMNGIVLSLIIIASVIILLLRQRKSHIKHKKQADAQLMSLAQKVSQLNIEKEHITNAVNEFLNNKDKRYELETVTPYMLKEDGEMKFRECFELLYPLFLHRLRDKVPAITRREELLSMLIVLKQDNKHIAELLAIAPRSVLMLRHRFRQKIGMDTEYSLENFIETILSEKQDQHEH